MAGAMSAEQDARDAIEIQRVVRYVQRMEQRLAFREREGRKLSEGNVRALREMHRLLGSVLDTVSGAIADSESHSDA